MNDLGAPNMMLGSSDRAIHIAPAIYPTDKLIIPNLTVLFLDLGFIAMDSGRVN